MTWTRCWVQFEMFLKNNRGENPAKEKSVKTITFKRSVPLIFLKVLSLILYASTISACIWQIASGEKILFSAVMLLINIAGVFFLIRIW